MVNDERRVGFVSNPDFISTPLEKLHAALDKAANPINDSLLREDDTLLITEAWMRLQSGVKDDFRRHFYVACEDGTYRSRQINPEEEGYWYAPYRQTFEEIHGEGGIRRSVEGIQIARTPFEAIKEAKRMAFVAGFSDARNCTKTEVLLSGPLKFEGQQNPKWIDVRQITQEQEKYLRLDHLNILGRLGYTPK